MTVAPTAAASPTVPGAGGAVQVQRWDGWLLPLLRLWPWWALLVVGRGVCLVAQRIPPVVLLVRAVRAHLGRRAGTA